MIAIGDVRQDNGIDWSEEKTTLKEQSYYFSLITFGKCVYWVNDRKIVMDKGDFLLIPGQNSYYGKSIPTVFHAKYVLNFTKTTDFPHLPILSSGEPIHFKIGCYDLIHERIKGILNQWMERLPYYDVLSAALLTESLTYINRELDRGKITSEKHKYVEKMRNYIQQHYRGKITKEDLGDLIGKSPNYAAILFSTVTGQTISEFVHSLRIKTAVYMLTESRLTIGEISEFLGYSDVSYFHKVFKRTTGKKPSDYVNERPRTL